MNCVFTPTLTVAASALLLSAKCAPNTTFGPEDAEAFLPTRLRYTELGPKSAVVTPRQAWEELAAAGRVVGDFIAWRLVDVTTGE